MNTDNTLWKQLKSWYTHPPGAQLAVVEAQQLSRLLPSLFGYYLLQLGEGQSRRGLEASPILQQIGLNRAGESRSGLPLLQGDYAHLPFKSDSIDVIILHHVLEFEAEPEKILEESWRVLMPEGHLIIFGFNPISIFALWRWFTRHLPKMSHACSATKVCHDLLELGVDIIENSSFFFRPPLHNKKWLHNLRFLDIMGQIAWPNGGAVYLIVAKKKVLTLTPIRPRWRAVDVGLAKGTVAPTTRGSYRGKVS